MKQFLCFVGIATLISTSLASPFPQETATATTATPLVYQPGGPIINETSTSTSATTDTPLSYNPGGPVLGLTTLPSPTCTDYRLASLTNPLTQATCTYYDTIVTATTLTACGACTTVTRNAGPGPAVSCGENLTLETGTKTVGVCSSYATATEA